MRVTVKQLLVPSDVMPLASSSMPSTQDEPGTCQL
jgi:hypothetical protein